MAHCTPKKIQVPLGAPTGLWALGHCPTCKATTGADQTKLTFSDQADLDQSGKTSYKSYETKCLQTATYDKYDK